jgi:NAD(P)-dependent dehydrogenase (short-subunit alcohol dehydrogenase family)
MPDTQSALHPNLSGRVALVTGASRGIGKALAIRLAEEGADVAIASKSEQSTDRLPGSIHETAEVIRGLNRKALAIPTDVRDEDAIRNMVEKTIAEFGRLDILVNNAGAIWAKPILETPPKRFDLMMGINTRAAYIAAANDQAAVGARTEHVPAPIHRTVAGPGGLHDFEAGHGSRGDRPGSRA